MSFATAAKLRHFMSQSRLFSSLSKDHNVVKVLKNSPGSTLGTPACRHMSAANPPSTSAEKLYMAVTAVGGLVIVAIFVKEMYGFCAMDTTSHLQKGLKEKIDRPARTPSYKTPE